MIKERIYGFITFIICFVIITPNIYATNDSLKDIKNELAKDEAKYADLEKNKKEVEVKINSAKKEIAELEKKVEECQNNIQKSKDEIERLNEEIIEKKKEIENLLSFLQVSEGDNVYLEYLFGAQDFTDFIYRSAVVEQLTEYNDNLIKEMNQLIEENKKLQIELQEKIEESEKETTNLEKKLDSYGLTVNDIMEDQLDVKKDIEARKKEVEYYEEMYKKNGCSEDTSIYSCIGVPYSKNFIKPLNKGTITSEYGMRYHPTLNYYRLHNGLDIGGNTTGTSVYSAAAGVVVKLTIRSSCGGNMVYIQHNIDGKKYRTVYMHLHTINVKIGDVVTNNTVIGTVGGGESYDGCSTGPHLHFGILNGWTGSSYLNPRNYIYFPAKGVKFTSRY